VTFLPSLAVSFRRLHDTGRSGWWVGSYFILIVGGALFVGFSMASNPSGDGWVASAGLFGLGLLGYAIMLIVFYCQIWTHDPNKYG
jgi:uncharacterized membrane protein YhaH (DUF805 family)